MAPAANGKQPVDALAVPSIVSSEGVLDEIQITGNTLIARGWAVSSDSANWVTGIRLLVDGVEVHSGGFKKQQRPDVAQAKGRPDWLESGWVIEATLIYPLPDGLRKIEATALLKNGERFDLWVPEELIPVVSFTPLASRELMGHLDEAVIEGDQLKVRGWVAISDPSKKIQTILLKSGDEVFYRGKFQIEERPDVAAALGKPEHLHSGWVVRLDWSGKEPPAPISTHFEMQTGEIIRLPVPVYASSQASIAPSAAQSNPILTRVAWLAAILLAGLAGSLAYRKIRHLRTPSSVEPDASTPFQRTGHSTILLLAGVFFSIFASKLFLIAHFGSGIPFWDQWDGEARSLLIPFLEGRFVLANLFSPHNEHRIALTRLLVLGLFVLNGQWDPLVSMVAQASLHAGILAFLVATVRSGMGSKSWALFAAITALLYAVPFSWNNTLWGFQSQFYFVLLTGLAGLWLTWKYADLSVAWWLGWTMLFMGLFAMGSGLLAPVAALGVGLVQVVKGPAPRRRSCTGLVALLLVVLLALRLLVNHPGHEPLKAQNVSNFFDYFFKLAAWPTEIPWAGLVLHLPVLAIGVYVLTCHLSRRDPAWFFATLGAWSVLAMAALAYGRANSALDSRYTDSLAFGLLTSLACALYLITLLCGKLRKIAQVAVAVGVAIAAAGIFHIFSDDLLSEIPERKAIEPIQKNHIQTFLATNDLQALENKPHLHIPYPSAKILAHILRQKALQDVLPAAIHPGLSPARKIFSESAFVANGGVYQTTKPVNPKPHFGSFTRAGNTSTGELRLGYPTAPAASRLSLAVSGYPLKEGMELFLETENGNKILIPVAADPRETWHEVVFNNPGVPFSIVAMDGSPSAWLAIGLPSPIGRLSIWTKWLLANWWNFGAVGAGCFVAGLLFKYTEKQLNI